MLTSNSLTSSSRGFSVPRSRHGQVISSIPPPLRVSRARQKHRSKLRTNKRRQLLQHVEPLGPEVHSRVQSHHATAPPSPHNHDMNMHANVLSARSSTVPVIGHAALGRARAAHNDMACTNE
eukprot:54648-Eustigmatos_ZCMA.PRE.2